jgi:Flp pilus assembly protein TadD
MAQGRHAEAIRLLEKASRLDPTSADTRYSLGLAYVRTGDIESARGEHVALQDLDPSLANLLGNLTR